MINLNQWIKEVDQQAKTLQEKRELEQAEFNHQIRKACLNIPALAVIEFLNNLDFIRNELRYFGPAPFSEKEVCEVQNIT